MAKAADKEDLRPGTIFGRHQIVRKLGAGGMAAVYEATHLELKKRVALKVLLPSIAAQPEIRARFIREGEAAAKIRHPHVVDVYDVGQEDGIAYLVMEYLEGIDLNQLLKREGALPAERIADIMLPVCDAVAAAHEEAVIHRDLKPGNIFLTQGRHGDVVPKILDFGISKIESADLGAALTTSKVLLGTPQYMSPEQARAQPADARSDQYSLGVILYHSATGKRPFEHDALYDMLHAIVEGDVTLPRQIRPDIPSELESVIVRAMKTRKHERFESVRALGAELLPFASERSRVLWKNAFGGVPSRAAVQKPAPTITLAAAPLSELSNTFSGATGVVEVRPRSRSVWPLIVAGLIFAVMGGLLVGHLLLPEQEAPVVVTPLENKVPESDVPSPVAEPVQKIEPVQKAEPVATKPNPAAKVRAPAKKDAPPSLKRGTNDALILH